MSAPRNITGLKPMVESMWAAGKSIEAICNELGLTRRAVGQQITMMTRYAAEPANTNNDEGHLADVLSARPEGFPWKELPAAYRVRA